MSFDQYPDPFKVKTPNRTLAVFGAGVLALGASIGAGYAVVSSIHNDVGKLIDGVGHIFDSAAPREYTFGEVQTALSHVRWPGSSQVIEGDAKGKGTVGSYTNVAIIGDFPGTTKTASVTRTGTVEIMARPNAITKVKAYELAGSTSNDPKYGGIVTVNADALYPAIYDPTTPINKGNVATQNNDGVVSSGKAFVFGGGTDGKYTSVATVVTDESMEVKCTQALVPLVPAGIQENYYALAQSSEEEVLPIVSKLTHGQQVSWAFQDIANKVIPIQVNLVDSKEQPVNSVTYKLKDASYVMSKQAIASALGADTSSTLPFNFSYQCDSTPQAVIDQSTLQANYLAHSGESASAAQIAADSVTGSIG
jgi:hypothetical protein